MPAYTKPQPAGLIVRFSRDGEQPEEAFARDGVHAWQQAIHLITKREWLLSGDSLSVHRTNETGQNAAVVRGLPRPRRE